MSVKYSGNIFIVPGLYNSGPDHWQTHWEKEFGFVRIGQKDWETPVCDDWTQTIDSIVAGYPSAEVILVGHSLGCCTVVRWAEKYKRIIRGALLVGPSDVEAPSYPTGTTGFSPMPVYHLPFPSIVIASINDEYVTLERANEFAENWGSELINAGELGHVNSASNLGNWSFGLAALQKLI